MYFSLPLLPPVPGAPPQNITLEVVLSRVSSTFLPWPTLYVSISPFVRVHFPPSSCLFPLLLFCYRLFSGGTASLSSRSLNPLTLGVSPPPPAVVCLSRFSTWFGKFPCERGRWFQRAAKQIISLPFIRSASASQKNNPGDENEDCVYAKNDKQQTPPPPPTQKKWKRKQQKRRTGFFCDALQFW